MPIGDYCEKPAATIGGEETVRAAAKRMRDEGLGMLVLVEGGGRPTGIVTDRDLVLATLCRRQDPGSMKLREITSGSPVTVEQDTPVGEAIRMIRRHGVRRLPVVDEKEMLVGVIAVDDLVSLLAAELNGLAVAIRAQSAAHEFQGGA